ncbi:MAG: hypothetical protein ACLPX8_26435 [Bryobacteraceae bacterium]|jgi:hypothetical protein
MQRLHRRGFLALGATACFSQGPIYAAGNPIRSVNVAPPVPVGDNAGDTWVAAWLPDGSLYSPSNDTKGFRNAGSGNIAFNRIDGQDPLHLSGTTVNYMPDYGVENREGPDGCTWKSSGCTAVGNEIYWVVARHKYGEKSGDRYRRQTAANASIIKTSDGGKTWTRGAKENYEKPMFPGSHFATPYFVEYGRASLRGVDNADRFVYATSNNGFWDNGDSTVLGRVPRERIGALNGADWEYFAGGDGLSDASWTRDAAQAKAVIESPDRLGMTGAIYAAARRRYVMINWYYPAGGGKMPNASKETVWDFYEAPHPWGPWTSVSSHKFTPQGFYCPEISPKFQQGDRLYVFAAGDWHNPSFYRLTVVPVELG